MNNAHIKTFYIQINIDVYNKFNKIYYERLY